MPSRCATTTARCASDWSTSCSTWPVCKWVDGSISIGSQRIFVELAREVAQERQQATDRHTIRVEAYEPRLVGLWDARRLGRVLDNLLDNAVKYSPDGGPIEVRLRRDGAWGVIDVTDEGLGIPEADQRRIFERFQRASNVEQRIGGTGIGLASAWHIVDSHGGTITVRSQEGSGTKFTVRLPIDLE